MCGFFLFCQLTFCILPCVFLPACFLQCTSVTRVARLHAQRFPDAPKGVGNACRQDNGYDDVLDDDHVKCFKWCKITNKILVLLFIVANFAIASCYMVGGYAGHTTNAYVCEFTEDGTAVRQFDYGVSPSCIFFNTIMLWQ